MKNSIKAFPILTIALSIVLFTSCKKDNHEPEPPDNNTNPCNYTSNVLVIGGTSKNITNSSCNGNASDYTSEHYTDGAHTEGLTMMFNGAVAPSAGTYTAVNAVPVAAGKVYVEYFETTNAYQPTSGTVTVSDNGSSKIYTFCNLSFTNGSATKTISVRATCN